MENLSTLGKNLRQARKLRFPKDDMQAFALRLGISRATLQKMEKGDLTVSLKKYVQAAELLACADQFEKLFVIEASLFDD